jgi:hypothetical protein
MPSLQQLKDAVAAYALAQPDALLSVVVDATFGHRIDAAEVDEFDRLIDANEIVSPPAGAVGRGDAFVLNIATKVGATVLSNDSYQEFHGTHEWLFDDGRLVGGKPVPHIGWVFVDRLPVRGATSRKAVSAAKRTSPGQSASGDGHAGSRGRRGRSGGAGRSGDGALAAETVRIGSPEANRPMPTPTAPPPAARRPAGGAERTQPADVPAPVEAPAAPREPTVSAAKTVNELMPFLNFVEQHPVGARVEAVVERYSSHGAYVSMGEVIGYVPLRLIADPAPRSARDHLQLGATVTLVVNAYAPARRSIDLAVPAASDAAPPAAAAALSDGAPKAAAPTPTRRRKGASATTTAASPAVDEPTSAPAATTDVVTAPIPATPSRRSKKAQSVVAQPAAAESKPPRAAAVSKPPRTAAASKSPRTTAATKSTPEPVAAHAVASEAPAPPSRRRRTAAAPPAGLPAAEAASAQPAARVAKQTPRRSATKRAAATPAAAPDAAQPATAGGATRRRTAR